MNIWFSFCEKDIDQAREWLKHVAFLGLQNHTIILHPAAKISYAAEEMRQLASKAFAEVVVEPDREGHEGWPQGPNSAFRQAAWYFYNRTFWMFCEPDTAVLFKNCFDRLESEYRSCGKLFMGDVAPAGKGYGKHMSGNAIYPAITPELLGKAMLAHHVPFDIAEPEPIVANMHVTPLIQHCFEYPERKVPTFPTQESLGLIRKDAVFFHRCKDGSLLKRLQEQSGKKPEVATVVSTPSGPNRYVVYTYHEQVPEMASNEWLLAKWAASWERAGFTPIVLGRETAETHSHFKQLNDYFESLPTINPKVYEGACWRRWMAMVQVGGGLMVDADVLPYGFSPNADYYVAATRWADKLPMILHSENPCPCVVWGNAEQYNNALFWFLENREKCIKTEQGQPHSSDQVAVQSGDPWHAVAICKQYGSEGWEKASLVHYCHASLAGRLREQAIPAAEKLRETHTAAIHNDMLSLPIPEKPKTWIDQIREAVSHLQSESKASDNNRTRIMVELKKAGLTPGGIKYAPEKKKQMKRSNRKPVVV